MPDDVVLQTWKEISDYVGRTERTLQRWERHYGFPVRRPSGKPRGSVMALGHEIEEWTRGKPSLVQIRGTARFSRALLGLGADGIPGVITPSPGSVGCFTAIYGESAMQRGAMDQARREHSELLQEQRMLREELAMTRAEQKTILKK